jgi:hypothetical protein
LRCGNFVAGFLAVSCRLLVMTASSIPILPGVTQTRQNCRRQNPR